MIVTIFRSRLNAEAQDEYQRWDAKMSALATAMPGYISHKRFIAKDGERVTIVEFDTEEHHRAWASHPEHRAAQALGRSRFYSEYHIQICTVHHGNRFKADSSVQKDA
jgi:heme-degrading monooxygenase HmoA